MLFFTTTSTISDDSDERVASNRNCDQATVRLSSDKTDRMSDSKMKDQRITVRFSPETRRRLKAAARRRGKRESDLVRDAVESQLAADEGSPTAFELAEKAGLIGVAKGKIRDLSTNPKHFDGFGA